jgi:hypothetical protein
METENSLPPVFAVGIELTGFNQAELANRKLNKRIKMS